MEGRTEGTKYKEELLTFWEIPRRKRENSHRTMANNRALPVAG